MKKKKKISDESKNWTNDKKKKIEIGENNENELQKHHSEGRITVDSGEKISKKRRKPEIFR